MTSTGTVRMSPRPSPVAVPRPTESTGESRPDARLLDAKVCDRDGFCAEDAILAGMEWAAASQRAPVANMSLGGFDTP